jgi:hypothetical protein
VGGEAVANRWAVRRWTVVGGIQKGDHWLPATDYRSPATGYRRPITDDRSAGVVGVLFAGLWSWVVREEARGRGGPPWGQAVNRDRGRMRNPISRRRTAVHGLTGCPRSLAGLAELRSKPTGGSSRSAAAAAATSITDPPGNPSLAGRRAGAVRRVVGRGRGDAPQLHQTAAAADSRRPIRTGHRCAQTRAGR